MQAIGEELQYNFCVICITAYREVFPTPSLIDRFPASLASRSKWVEDPKYLSDNFFLFPKYEICFCHKFDFVMFVAKDEKLP